MSIALTTKQAGERLGMSRRAVLHYVHRDKDPIPAIPLGRAYRIDPDDLEAWIQRQKERVS